MKHRILIVDDEPLQREIISEFLTEHEFATMQAASGEEALSLMTKRPADLVISDMRMGKMTGKALLGHLKQAYPLLPFIMVTAYGKVSDAVDIMKEGATDYLTKPVDLSELLVKIRKAVDHKLVVEENARLRDELLDRRVTEKVISRSPLMMDRLSKARRAARTKVPILLTGPSGTGKELFAQTIHALSPRHQGAFIPVNCASLASGVLESELFGHEPGAFTGARGMRKGRFEMSHSGTLFLDEIGDIPPETQVKLLRVLQESTIERVGGDRPIHVDFRLICATHRDLRSEIDKGTFREDLFYRINVVNIELPALKERREDIPLLLDHFLKITSRRYGITVKGFSKEAFARLVAYDYPGNIRELINIVQKAIVLSRDDVIGLAELDGVAVSSDSSDPDSAESLPRAVADLEKRMIVEALHASDDVQVKAAEKLGVSERTLRYKLEKYGLSERGRRKP